MNSVLICCFVFTTSAAIRANELSQVIPNIIRNISNNIIHPTSTGFVRDDICSVSRPCVPSACCSKFGNCGFSSEHCGTGCLSGCNSKPEMASCSKTNPCSPSACCSEFGNCGFSSEHCGPGCVSACNSKPPPTECSANKPCTTKSCCSKHGSCGFGPDFCGTGCLNTCDAKPECGKYAVPAGKKCPLNVCCSKFGFCGLTKDFCTNGCQSGCKSPGKPSCGSPPSQYHIGYYSSWSSERVCGAVAPQDIKSKSYTHLNYAFGQISNGIMIEPSGKELSLVSEIVGLKKSNPRLKILVSVGGWSFNDPGPTRNEFHNIVTTPGARTRFINSASNYLSKYDFDGIDIDYEYPTAEDRGGFPTDTENYLSLVKEMRESFGSKFLITIACPASYWYLRNFKIGAMSEYLDFINLMSYDFHGTWNKDSAEFGNIVRSHTDIKSIRGGLDLLFRDGVEPDKIALGLGTYGRSYTLESSSCREIDNCRFSGPGKPGKCTAEPGTLARFEIEEIIKDKNVKPSYDESSASQVLSYDDQWISYDDKKTLDIRIQLAKEYCLIGTMVWTVDMDVTEKVSKWRECIEMSNCCDRPETFCVNCDSGCIYKNILTSESYSDSPKLGYLFPRWMTELPDELMLSEMSIPGTHDSGAIDVDWPNERLAQTQSMTIENQLQAGIRALDIRCHHRDNKFTIHHGPIFLHLNFDDVLQAVTGFLNENPGEVVLMRIKDENNDQTNDRSFAETLQEYIDKYSDFFWMDTTLPKLGEARGKIVILDNTPKSPGFGPSWGSFEIQDDYELPETGTHEYRIAWKWVRAFVFFEKTNAGDLETVYINFLSAFDFFTVPYIVASGKDQSPLEIFNEDVEGMNEYARKYLNPENEGGTDRAGWVYMDFPGPSLIYSILIHN